MLLQQRLTLLPSILGEGDNSTPITVVSGKDAAPNLDGKTPNRMNFGGETIATLSDGLKFGANVGDVYGAKLNSQNQCERRR